MPRHGVRKQSSPLVRILGRKLEASISPNVYISTPRESQCPLMIHRHYAQAEKISRLKERGIESARPMLCILCTVFEPPHKQQSNHYVCVCIHPSPVFVCLPCPPSMLRTSLPAYPFLPISFLPEPGTAPCIFPLISRVPVAVETPFQFECSFP